MEKKCLEGLWDYGDEFLEQYQRRGPEFVQDFLENGNAALKGGTSALAQYGDDFGKMGTYVENPNIKVDWTQYAGHAAERMQQRGMTQEMVNNIVENGKVLSQNNGNNFDSSMLEIISKLFGE